MPGSTFTGSAASASSPATPSTPIIVQRFCTVNDLIDDTKAPGADEARMYGAIREASDYLMKRLGWFIPVTQTLRLNGLGSKKLFVPPLLAITSIINDDTTLTSSDYILKPGNRFWPDGPYTRLVVHPEAANLSVWVCEENGVVITGRWGKYEKYAVTGATVQDTTGQSDSQTTLKVSDGGKVSPGMVLLIGDEQEEVTGWGSPTASVTTLNGAVAVGDETITVANGALVNVGEVLRSTFEQMKVLDKQTHTLEVIRGWNGTRRVAHSNGAAVDVYRTINVERAVNGTTAAAHANASAISRYFVPNDLLYLCKEIATLIVNKAKSQYQGRTGNEQTGVISYNDAFPKYDIELLCEAYKIPRLS